jgi:homoserine kinase
MSWNRARPPLDIRSQVHVSSRNSPGVKQAQASGEALVSSVGVTAPCTSANLGPGFDVFALALDAFQDTIRIQISFEAGVKLEITGLDSESVPVDPNLNSAGLVAQHMLRRHGEAVGVNIRIDKGVPVGKGLGSSAASAAATAVGLNYLLGLGLTENEIVETAAQGEIASAGVAHADNVAAAVLGGFTLVQSYSPFSVVRLRPPSGFEIAIAIPDIPTPSNKTERARAVLPDRVPLGKVAHNVGGAASIVAGILSEDIELIGKGMVDAIIEPARARLVPGYAQVKQAALAAGAEGVAISGAGPSVIAIVDNARVSAASVADAMRTALESSGVQCRALVAKAAGGATVLEE